MQNMRLLHVIVAEKSAMGSFVTDGQTRVKHYTPLFFEAGYPPLLRSRGIKIYFAGGFKLTPSL
jgi:hypothetical protein